MKKILLSAALILMTTGSAIAAPVIGEPAPAFTGTDTNGVEHSLSDFTGSTVVLEWTNPECPYVRKHYNTGNMQALQAEATQEGIVWLTIASSADGKQGYMTPDEANALITEEGSQATARILDPSGEIGGLYDAKTTPHMFVIDPAGVLVYQGAIDDDPSFKKDNMETATNYVRSAWEAVASGENVEVSTSQPYGCSVKY